MQMTVMIEPGDDYCFFVPNITTGQNFEFDFQVDIVWLLRTLCQLLESGDGEHGGGGDQ